MNMSKNKLEKNGFILGTSHKSYSNVNGGKLKINYSAKSRFYALLFDILFLSLFIVIKIVLLYFEKVIGARFFLFTSIVTLIFMIVDLCKYLKVRKFELENDFENLSDL